ncbi:MAG TPA: glycosyltransferase family 2 protein [Chitinophagales bacterium]|nr:glycosyltransferase family 2 protein [Chitinophagales bacterium]
MPCLNEAETIGTCIRKARKFLESNKIEGEIVIGDNGSTDGSQAIAQTEGARVVPVPQRGYGAALLGAIKEAKGKYIIMGDSDDSYDFLHLELFVEKLREGYDLVMGNRFRGGIEKGAMPFLHKYLGNPVLSFIGRLFFNIKIGDFHCGLRGFRKDSIQRIGLITPGMEFASEMVVKASLFNLKITEVPTRLFPDGRSRPPHLRTWRDGWRHLRFLLLYSPKWLFLFPGAMLFILSAVLFIILINDRISIGNIQFDIHTLMYLAVLIVLSTQLISFYLVSKIYAVNTGLIPVNKDYNKIFSYFNLERGMLFSVILILIGIALGVRLVLIWNEAQFAELHDLKTTFRILIPSILFLVVGFQSLFLSFVFSTLGIIQNHVMLTEDRN